MVADISFVLKVEDYAFGYLGDGRQVKDFVREFLERRSQSRPKKVDKDVSFFF